MSVRVLRAGALLSTTLTLASAARGLRTLPRPFTLVHRLAPSGARARSAIVLAAGPDGSDGGEPTAVEKLTKPRQREIDLRGFIVPFVNDVVRYPSKWPGEYLLGAVDYVQALPEDRGYIVDVRPLRSVGGERWECRRGSKLVQEDSGRLRVVKEATYDQQADAWTVPEAVTMSLFSTAKPRPADPARLTSGLEEYDSLKWRLIRESAIVSLAGVLGLFALKGAEQAEAYALGAVAGVGYVFLLARSVDALGKGGLAEALAPLRFVAPVSPFVVLAAQRYSAQHGADASAPLSLFDSAGGGFLASGLIPPEQFLAMALGVLTHRLPLLARELQAIAATGAAETGLTGTAPDARAGANLPTSGSLVAGASMLTGAARAAEEARIAKAQREAAAREAASRRRPIVISGPSAVGKSTLIRRLLAELGGGLGFCVSTTTRAPRAGEVDGVDYVFVSKDKFENLLEQGGFVEWVQGGNGTYYGTAVSEIQRVADSQGKAAVLDLDVKGAAAVRAVDGLDPCCVFISPPSLYELEARLRARGTESEEEMAYRMRRASSEIEAAATLRIFEHYLINDDLEKTYAELKQIVLNANRWLKPLDAAAGGGASAGA